ncbi:MAG: GNAT family N-acetyltransferase, partial [Catonella sp.]
MLKIRDLEARDREEVFKMMRIFYNSEAVLYTAPDEILYKDIDDCLSDLPFIEGYVFEEEGELVGYAMAAKSYTTEYGGLLIF